jgi:hypothetical protein
LIWEILFKALVVPPKDIPLLRYLLRSPMAMVLAIPIALIFGFESAFAFGLGDSGLQVMGWVFLWGWLLLTGYLTWSASIRIIWGKTCIAYAIVAFLFPVAAIAFSFVFSAQETAAFAGIVVLVIAELLGTAFAGIVVLVIDELLGTAFAGIVVLVIAFTLGLFTGLIGLTLGYYALRNQP